MHLWTRLLAMASLVSMVMVGSAFAAYPDRPITMIVPFGAGGSTDVPARVLANALEKKLGQTIVVQNVVGGAGTQGVAQAAAAKADGYTILYGPTGAMVLQPHVGKTPYGKDSFDYIGNVMRLPVVLMSAKSAPWKNVQEMIEIVKKEPNKYIVGITGTGNMTHVPVLELAKRFDLKFRIMPYRSAAEIVKDMNAGRTQLFADTPVVLSQGELFGLLQYAEKPFKGIESIPTTASIGFNNYMAHWQGIFTPKGLPADVQATLAKALQEVVTSAEFIADAAKVSTAADWMSAEDYKKYVEKEFEDYGVVIRDVLPKQ